MMKFVLMPSRRLFIFFEAEFAREEPSSHIVIVDSSRTTAEVSIPLVMGKVERFFVCSRNALDVVSETENGSTVNRKTGPFEQGILLTHETYVLSRTERPGLRTQESLIFFVYKYFISLILYLYSPKSELYAREG